MARILIAVDDSPASLRALESGASLAAKLGEGVVLLHAMPQVTPPVVVGPGSLSELQHTLEAEGLQLLESLADKVRRLGVAVETELGVGDPAIAIYDRAEALDIQMVVMGTRGQGAVARLLLGSVAAKVVHTSSKPVMVVGPVNEPGGGELRRILVAVDGTEVAREAARMGLELAGRVGARVTLVHVLPRSVAEGETADFAAFERACEDYARGLLAEMRQVTGCTGPTPEVSVLHGEPAEAIAKAAGAEDVGLVIVGTRARGTLARTLLGSVADTLLRQSPKPLMVVPEAPRKVLTPQEDTEEELEEALAPPSLGAPG